MSLGNALLQPSVFERDNADPIQGLIDDLGRLIAIFVEDAVASGPLLPEVQGAIDEVGDTVIAWFTEEVDGQTRQDRAMGRLTSHVAPFQSKLLELVDSAGAIEEDPSTIVGLIRDLLDLARSISDAATLPTIRNQLEIIREVLEDDLGFEPAFVTDRIAELLTALNRRLGDLPTPVNADARRRINLARAIVARLSLRSQLFAPPDLDTEPLARTIYRLLDSSGVTEILKQVGCAMDGIEAAFNAAVLAGEAVATVPQAINAGVASKDDAAEYSYYASWLLKDEFIPMIGLSDLNGEAAFLNKLKTGTHSVILALRTALGTDLRDRLMAFSGSNPDRDFVLEILAAINREIQRAPILNLAPASGLADSALTEEIRDLRSKYLSKQSLFKYNRRVVELGFGSDLDTFSDSWYRQYPARWFLVATGYPRNQVFVTGDRKFVMCDDVPLHFGTSVKWSDAPMFAGEIVGGMWFRFQPASAKFCEYWAQISSLAGEAAKAIWHTMMIQPGHEAQNAMICSMEYADLIQQVLWGKPISAYGLEKGPHLRRWMKTWDSAFGFKGISTLLTTFQVPQATGTREWGLFWLTVFGGDFFRTLTPIFWVNKAVNLLIGTVTLVNFGGPRNGPLFMPTNPAHNHTKQDAWVSLSDTLYLILLVSLYPRDIYSIDLWRKGQATTKQNRVDAYAVHWTAGGIGMGAVAGLSGSIVAQSIARSIDLKRLFATMGWSALRCWLQYWFYNYKFRENATSDGEFTPRSPVVFRGYPDKDSSPYLLPYPGGMSHYAGQGNLGLFSHNPLSNVGGLDQTYAYDFSHDFLEPIACVRSGVVTQITEGFADGNTANRNIIIVLHDGPPDPVHDDYGAGPVRTFARYLHLAMNGVSNSPVAPVVGDAVAQGDLIALAGDTGNSFHNHLHLDVMPQTLASVGGTPVMDNFSIPFVFRDGQNGLLPGSGNLQSTSWHRSENV